MLRTNHSSLLPNSQLSSIGEGAAEEAEVELPHRPPQSQRVRTQVHKVRKQPGLLRGESMNTDDHDGDGENGALSGADGATMSAFGSSRWVGFDESEVLFSGVMMKTGPSSVFKSWRYRFFVLAGAELFYYSLNEGKKRDLKVQYERSALRSWGPMLDPRGQPYSTVHKLLTTGPNGLFALKGSIPLREIESIVPVAMPALASSPSGNTSTRLGSIALAKSAATKMRSRMAGRLTTQGPTQGSTQGSAQGAGPATSASPNSVPDSPNSESDDGQDGHSAPPFFGTSSPSSSASSSGGGPSSALVTFDICCSARTFAMRALDLNQLDTLKDRVAFAVVRLEKVL